MMIYGNIRKSKPKTKSKREREEYDAWLKKHKVTPKSKTRSRDVVQLSYSLGCPAGRENKQYRSLDTGFVPATKSEPKVYTGTSMLGIGTLHKSNAIPVFSTEEAHDMAKMRR
jgi:hypothetical protein